MKIFIAGGSSGIGLALAKKYLSLNHEVAICGRNINKLNRLKEIKNLKVYQVDIYNKDDYYNAVLDFSNGNLDMLISVAGFYVNNKEKKLTLDESRALLKTNIAGALNSFEIGTEIMAKKGSGQIVVFSSVAGLIDYSKASIYSKTKRTLISIANTYREALKDFNIKVITIIPGYINTEKLRELNNGNIKGKPFIISEDKAVDLIVEAISKNKEEFIFPFKMKILMRFLALLPKSLLNIVFKIYK